MDISIREVVRSAIEAQQVTMGEGTSLRDAVAAFAATSVSGMHAQWMATQNPIWVWRCIARQHSLSEHVRACFPGLEAAVAIPPWCGDYLVEVAYRIEVMAGGRDFATPGAMQERLNSCTSDELPSTDAPSRLPAALGLVRPGWNAFREYQSDDFPRLFLTVQETDRAAGRKPTMKLRELMDVMGWVDERSARRKLAALRRGAKPPLKV